METTLRVHPWSPSRSPSPRRHPRPSRLGIRCGTVPGAAGAGCTWHPLLARSAGCLDSHSLCGITRARGKKGGKPPPSSLSPSLLPSFCPGFGKGSAKKAHEQHQPIPGTSGAPEQASRAGAKVCRAARKYVSVPSVPRGDTPMPAPTQPGDDVPGQTGEAAAGREVGRGVGVQGKDAARNQPLLSPKRILGKIIPHHAPGSSPQPLPD